MDDAGWELRRGSGVTRALLVTDPGSPPPARVACASVLRAAGIDVVVYDRVAGRADAGVAAARPRTSRWTREVDGFVSVGGGSSIDTAKVANLIVSHPAPVMAYVNAPVGEGRAPAGPLLPHLAIPTTCGTGSEATTVAVLDIPEQRVKTGISHRYLRPSQAIVDPDLASTLPPRSWPRRAGRDLPCGRVVPVLPFSARPRPASPARARPTRARTRSPTSGRRRRWSTAACTCGALSRSGDDVEARGFMMLAASMAGVGFGSAGVHIPHACAYPIAGLQACLCPAGLSLRPSLRAARDLRDRHRTARRSGSRTRPRPSAMSRPPPCWARSASGPDALPSALSSLMADLGVPSLSELGYGEEDIPALVRGARAQERLLVGAPREVTDADLSAILRASLHT